MPSMLTLSTLKRSKTELLGNQQFPYVVPITGIYRVKHNSVSAMLMYFPTASAYRCMLKLLPSGTNVSQFLKPTFVYKIFVGNPEMFFRYIIL